MQGCETLKTSWCSFSDLLTQNQTQIERGVMNQHSLQNVGSSSQVNTPKSTGFQAMSERSFQHQTSLPQKFFAAGSTNSPAICIDSLLLFGFVLPFAAATIRLGHVGPYTCGAKQRHRVVALITLVGHQLRQRSEERR